MEAPSLLWDSPQIENACILDSQKTVFIIAINTNIHIMKVIIWCYIFVFIFCIYKYNTMKGQVHFIS